MLNFLFFTLLCREVLDGHLAKIRDTHPCLEQFYLFAKQKLLQLVDDDFSMFGLSLISTADEHLDTFELHLQKIFNFMFLLHKRLTKLSELKSAPETLSTSITDLKPDSALMLKVIFCFVLFVCLLLLRYAISCFLLLTSFFFLSNRLIAHGTQMLRKLKSYLRK